MSASSKKKLRKEQEAGILTERQQAALKEAKKTKMMTGAFVIAMVLILVIAISVGVNQFINNSGVRQKTTTALTVNGHELSSVELNYFYIDTVNNYYSQNGSYLSLFGLDASLPLNKQVFDTDTGETWADYFLESAKNTATSVYSMNDLAAAEGFTLSEDLQSDVEGMSSALSLYASAYGYPDAEAYVEAMYGKGATVEGLTKYVEMSLLANSYITAHEDSLTFTDAELRAAEADNYHNYSSFTYNYYYLAASRFLEGGVTEEDGTTTYSAEEEAAAIVAAEEAAKSIVAAGITSVEDLDAAVAALPINAEATEAKSTGYTDYSYSAIDKDLSAWLTEPERKTGDVEIIPNMTTVTAEDGTETSEILGYFVAYFQNVNDNNFALKNVRHILVSFEGGTTDEYGSTTYTDEEKAAAKATAEEILSQWKAGEATEDSFAALATEKSSDTGSTANGGLYENVYPGQMVSAFQDWCYDSSRKAGDTGIVETTYGYHIMYFSGNSDENYRDYQIKTELVTNAQDEWFKGIIESADVVLGETKYLSMDLVLGGMY